MLAKAKSECACWLLEPDAPARNDVIPRRRVGLRFCRLTALILLVGLLGCSTARKEAGTPTRASVSVAAAADLKFAFADIISAFQEKHPELDVRVSYGSSGSFFAQLLNRAPFDLFLSADMDYPRQLMEKQLVLPDSLFVYAVGHLVIWVPRNSVLDVEKLGLQVLLDPSARKIAIANPRFAPYGRAAEAALKSTGLYDKVKDRLVYGENVTQTAQFVQTGAADVGLISLSLAVAPALRTSGRYAEVPLDAYPRMEQGGVILSWTTERRAAEALRDFLVSEEGKKILRRYGFSV
jgi:molybdate transport system substrate-binding protein